jgi:hypothetical protein
VREPIARDADVVIREDVLRRLWGMIWDDLAEAF